jgi:type I restriction enzyme R subunit
MLDEDATRALIDEQLRLAGWEADSIHLRYKDGARPETGRHRAIAEWPTESGPADYALFIGKDCVGVIEAKRRNRDVAAAIDQAKRYARGMLDADKQPLPVVSGDYRVPVVFSTNGRPFQRQFQELSGTWFCDLRRPQNLRKALDGWYTPPGLKDLLKQDLAAAEQALDTLGFHFSFPLRAYQRDAILAAEQAIRDGKPQCLLAMATGTGKTKTCIALVYRLLKAQRFRRILFLVDRSALGEQAANAFKETQMESLQRFSEIFGLKELDDAIPDADTQVHIATVQGLVKRILYSDEPLPVDTYDCIVVDECHRGYLLDREMSDTEATFRDQKDYVSKYRRVLDHFDAVKIGLTATPALHTSEIFGPPVYVYSYREAVLDGHSWWTTTRRCTSAPSSTRAASISTAPGEEVAVYNVEKESVDLYHTPGRTGFRGGRIQQEGHHRKLQPRGMHRADRLRLTPFGPEKTLVFCATDRHADMVVRLLKEAFRDKGWRWTTTP